MDILRKELTGIYQSQQLAKEVLPSEKVADAKIIAQQWIKVCDGCSVVTDAARDVCCIYSGALGSLLGFSEAPSCYKEYDSSDEDEIYTRMHPEDLVEKRMLEYEFFKYIDPLDGGEKMQYQAVCRIRISDREENWWVIDNTTQVICHSPEGKIWLILCTYSLSADQSWKDTICPKIKNNHTGKILEFSFSEQRCSVLSPREKEILKLIKEGHPSKVVAHKLSISIHTVNRHRQNIIEKLSVGSSIEAIMAAERMRLL